VSGYQCGIARGLACPIPCRHPDLTSGCSRAVSQFTCTFRHFRGWLFLDEKATRQFRFRCKAHVKPLQCHCGGRCGKNETPASVYGGCCNCCRSLVPGGGWIGCVAGIKGELSHRLHRPFANQLFHALYPAAICRDIHAFRLKNHRVLALLFKLQHHLAWPRRGVCSAL
jgi:hypothetical protein